MQQVLRRECERIELKTGKVSTAVTYRVTSVAPAAATPLELEGWWRGHWMIENRVQYVRDVTMGEDGHQMHTGQAPQALAALRNTVLTLLRRAGWTTIAAALGTTRKEVSLSPEFGYTVPSRLWRVYAAPHSEI